MSQLTILIIRHAEKPGENWPGPGLTPEGAPDDPSVLVDKSLVIRGWQRAGSWAALFGGGLGGVQYPQPAVIYALDPDSSDGNAGASMRPFQTIIPLAARLNLKPIVKYGIGDETKLVNEIVKLTGCVLVCWEHKKIGKAILPALAKDQVIPNMPSKWDGTRFDIVLRFDRAVPGAPWTFVQQFPRLLSGDSDTPMP